jgi:hypothetical protein
MQNIVIQRLPSFARAPLFLRGLAWAAQQV